MRESLAVGVVGCGAISAVYLANLAQSGGALRLVACADVDLCKAEASAARFGIRAERVEELIADPTIDLVVNLTPPLAHAELSMAALAAGKHVYSEKPLATTLSDAERVVQAARSRGLHIGGAPDTFMGGGISICARIIGEGSIGEIVGGYANALSPGPESWHPNPSIFYARGGGPVLDRGPYFIAALVTLLGPVAGVFGATRMMTTRRVVGSGPDAGKPIAVEVQTHAAGILRFVSGAAVSATMSFDVQATRASPIEIWGTEGTIIVPDPVYFGGTVLCRRSGQKEWEEVPAGPRWSANLRGMGVIDMAESIVRGLPYRASGELCLHVLEVLECLADPSTSAAGHHIVHLHP